MHAANYNMPQLQVIFDAFLYINYKMIYFMWSQVFLSQGFVFKMHITNTIKPSVMNSANVLIPNLYSATNVDYVKLIVNHSHTFKQEPT